MITLLGRATGIAISTSRTLRAATALRAHAFRTIREHDANTRREIRIAAENLRAAALLLDEAEQLITRTITVEA